MKTLCTTVSLLLLAACTKQPIHAPGVYRLSTAEKTMVLEVRTGGDYVLQINGADRNPDQIRGRWESEQEPVPVVSFHGIVWQGTEPESGQGTWAATLEDRDSICLDAESLNCFIRDDAA